MRRTGGSCGLHWSAPPLRIFRLGVHQMANRAAPNAQRVRPETRTQIAFSSLSSSRKEETTRWLSYLRRTGNDFIFKSFSHTLFSWLLHGRAGIVHGLPIGNFQGHLNQSKHYRKISQRLQKFWGVSPTQEEKQAGRQ